MGFDIAWSLANCRDNLRTMKPNDDYPEPESAWRRMVWRFGGWIQRHGEVIALLLVLVIGLAIYKLLRSI